ncbi:MAG: hypothetical protein ABSG88_16795 [Bradyrhizobium sp.]
MPIELPGSVGTSLFAQMLEGGREDGQRHNFGLLARDDMERVCMDIFLGLSFALQPYDGAGPAVFSGHRHPAR